MQVNINLINFAPANNKKQNYTSRPAIGGGTQFKEYSPVTYKDYNINFGARLFRSPENFYEQDFNEKNMPKTLHKYIYESYDSDFKRTIPPAQAMKEVFGKINFAKDLDTVKMMFPDEPLFKELSSVPQRKSREGLLGVINMLKDDPDYAGRTLFKNGDNDLGMYILKKIYIEGKSLKEINKDFAKDVSVHFKSYDIKPQDYNAFGIKFPNHSFWKSFTATREDFPYVYIPRNAGEKAEIINSAAKMSKNDKPAAKKHRELMTFEQRKQLADSMIRWHAGLTPEEKAEWNRKRMEGLGNSVTHNYFGEIVLIAQDKVNYPDKLSEYLEKIYGDPNYAIKSSGMDRFWKSNQMFRKEYSRAMVDTITKFDETYGDDGENYEFLRLLALARGIKQNNEEGRQVREQIRAEIKSEKEAAQKVKEQIIEVERKSKETSVSQPEFSEILKNEAKKNNAKIYNFKLSNGTDVSIVANLQESFTEKLNAELANMPSSYKNKFIKFALNHPKATEDYLLSLFYGKDNFSNSVVVRGNGIETEKRKAEVAEEIQNMLMSVEDRDKITVQIQDEFAEQNSRLVQLTQQAFMELIPTIALPDQSKLKAIIEEKYQKMVHIGVIPENVLPEEKAEITSTIFNDIMKDFSRIKKCHVLNMDVLDLSRRVSMMQFNPLTAEQKKFLEDKIQKYRTPLSNSEIKKISHKLINEMLNFDISKSQYADDNISALYRTSIEAIKRYPEARSVLPTMLLTHIIKPENSTLRYFIEKNPDPNIIQAKVDEIIKDLLLADTEFFKLTASLDNDLLETYCKNAAPEIYNMLLPYRSLKAASYLLACKNSKK